MAELLAEGFELCFELLGREVVVVRAKKKMGAEEGGG